MQTLARIATMRIKNRQTNLVQPATNQQANSSSWKSLQRNGLTYCLSMERQAMNLLYCRKSIFCIAWYMGMLPVVRLAWCLNLLTLKQLNQN